MAGKSRRVATGATMAAFVALDASSAQMLRREAPVEVVAPNPPTPVVVDGARVLAYELHVTNFGSRPLVLESVDVFPAVRDAKPLMTLRDSVLRAAVAPAGEMTIHGAGSLAPGMREVVFLWIRTATTSPVAPRLRHRLTFGVLDSAGRRDPVASPSVIDEVYTPVDQASVSILGAPFRGGDWLAGNGPSNESDHRRALVALNGKARIAQRFAIDWVKIGPNGNTWHDDRNRVENYWGFGEPVLAVADGDVVEAVDSIADNPRGHLPTATIANIAGNHVIVRIGPSRFVMFAHLKHGSVRVRVGQQVKRGALVGQLGNSGQSTGPHMHLQVMDAPSPLAAEGMPFVLDSFTFLGLGRDYEPGKRLNVSKRRELPIGEAVVHLPGGPQ
jgi:murein DD-endopeptidase